MYDELVKQLRDNADHLQTQPITNADRIRSMTDEELAIEMTAKQYLNRVRRIDKEIAALLRLVQSTRESLETITQNYNSDGAQSSKNPHKFDRLVELESLVDAKIDEQIAMKAETLETIMKLQDRRQRLVLIEYFIDMKTWEQVAVDLNYSYQHTMRIYGFALKEVKKVLESGV